METMPMPLDALSSDDSLDDFRVSSPREISLMMKQLCDGAVPLHLNASGRVVTTAVWTMDNERATIGFNADESDPALQALLECRSVVAVGYLDNVKLQFEVHDPVLVHGSKASVLKCAFPAEIFRFQRRNAFRVRPLSRNTPLARLRHADFGEADVDLRLIDVSIGGCALFLPVTYQAPQLGLLANDVLIDLDADTRFHVNVRLQHVTSLSADAQGVRLGFEFVRASGDALRALQRFIDQTQKRGKLMALN